MNGPGPRLLPYGLAFFSSLCIMVLELVASRLVARHVGSSLIVWNSVIGIMLGGICLGNFLGGRLADRVEPARAVGPLYALGAALTLACLWLNALGGLIPDVTSVPWLRTIALVTLDFLVPGTVLGMISPVVAKLAVEQARKTGSAIGDVYFLGAIGSIVGTFLAGFILLYYFSVSVVVTIVAACLALIGGLLIGGSAGLSFGLVSAGLLALGSFDGSPPASLDGPSVRWSIIPVLNVGGVPLNALMLIGHAATLGLAALGAVRLGQARTLSIADEPAEVGNEAAGLPRPKLGDLAALSFIVSLAFMAFEMAGSRFVTHHLGSSIYGWTSVIGVLLAGLSIGNFLGGKLANVITREKQASWLFLIASVGVLSVLLLESPPRWIVKNPFEYLFKRVEGERIFPYGSSALSMAISSGMAGWSWWARVVIVVSLMFFLPALTLGTVSPVVAKLAVERVRQSKRTGRAIGQVYAWGMVGSILGTFLTGFYLIDQIGTKGVILLVATLLALSATFLGTFWHAIWAGIPLGCCMIAFLPFPIFEHRAIDWGLRDEAGDPATEVEDARAYVDESNYYYIKVENSPVALGQKRTIVLDNLIHGYYVLGHPEQIEYDYEFIYGLVAHRVARAKAAELKKEGLSGLDMRVLFFGGGAYTFPRYLQHTYPGTRPDVAEIDPAILRTNKAALGLGSAETDAQIETTIGDARAFVERNQGKKYDMIFGDAFNDFSVPWHMTTREFNDRVANMLTERGVYMINIIDEYESDARVDELVARQIKKVENPTDARKAEIRRVERATADRKAGFLGAWVETARKTFKYVTIYGTDTVPGNGQRETFVVVVSNAPIDLDNLGGRDDDPKFFEKGNDRLVEPKAFPPEDVAAVARRSKGIILTDDYAPVDNLLAPVAESRGKD